MSSKRNTNAETESTLIDNDQITDALQTLPPDAVDREDDRPITSGATDGDDAPVLEEQNAADLQPEEHAITQGEEETAVTPLDHHDEDVSSLPDDTPSVQACLR